MIQFKHTSAVNQTCSITLSAHTSRMFSHIVVFWTDPAQPKAADEVIESAQRLLKDIPGIRHFHVGKMVPTERPVVDHTYQVALNVVFDDRKAQDQYQVHPKHREFVDTVFKRVCKKAWIYDFE